MTYETAATIPSPTANELTAEARRLAIDRARTAAATAANIRAVIRARVSAYYQDRTEHPPTRAQWERAIDQVEQAAEEANAAATESRDAPAAIRHARAAAATLEKILADYADEP